MLITKSQNSSSSINKQNLSKKLLQSFTKNPENKSCIIKEQRNSQRTTDSFLEVQLSLPNSSSSLNHSFLQNNGMRPSVTAGSISTTNSLKAKVECARDEYYQTTRQIVSSSNFQRIASQRQLNKSENTKGQMNASKSACRLLIDSPNNSFSQQIKNQSSFYTQRNLQLPQDINSSSSSKIQENYEGQSKLKRGDNEIKIFNNKKRRFTVQENVNEIENTSSSASFLKQMEEYTSSNFDREFKPIKKFGRKSQIVQQSEMNSIFFQNDQLRSPQSKIRFNSETKKEDLSFNMGGINAERPFPVTFEGMDSKIKVIKKGILKQKTLNIFDYPRKSLHINENDDAKNEKITSFIEQVKPRESIGENLRIFIQGRLHELEDDNQTIQGTPSRSKIDRNQCLSPKTPNHVFKNMSQFVGKKAVEQRSSLKTAGSINMKNERNGAQAKMSFIVKERQSIIEYSPSNNQSKNQVFRFPKYSIAEGTQSPIDKIRIQSNDQIASSINSDESSLSVDKGGKKQQKLMKTQKQKMKEQKHYSIFKPISSQLTQVQIMETLSFWQKLKKEIYSENELERSYKKNSFDVKAIACYMEVVEKINSLCEQFNFNVNCYEDVEKELDDMTTRLKDFKNLTSFFVSRLFALQGKFNIKCGNLYHAMKCFTSAKKIVADIGDFPRKLRIHRQLGQCFKLLKDYDRAKSHFIKMLKLSWITNNRDQELKAYDELGIIYYYDCEVLLAQRLHMRICKNITENHNSQVRKSVIDTFRKQLRSSENGKLLSQAPMDTQQNLSLSQIHSDQHSSSHLDKSNHNSTSYQKQKAKKIANSSIQGEQSNAYGLNLINIAFSESSEDEPDFFVRELIQQDVIREDMIAKEKMIEERSELNAKNINLRYSALSQEREIEKQNDQIYQRILQSEKFQYSVDDHAKKKNPAILISHLGRNRYYNNYKEDSYREHQYFHLKLYQDQLFKQMQKTKKQAPSIVDLSDSGRPSSGKSSRRSNSPRKISNLVNSNISEGDLDPSQELEAKISKTLFKFSVPLLAFQGLLKDLGKLKKQIILLLNNIEKLESSGYSSSPARRKNALHFY